MCVCVCVYVRERECECVCVEGDGNSVKGMWVCFAVCYDYVCVSVSMEKVRILLSLRQHGSGVIQMGVSCVLVSSKSSGVCEMV